MRSNEYREFLGGNYKVVFSGKTEKDMLIGVMPSNDLTMRIRSKIKDRNIVIVYVEVAGYDPKTHLGGTALFFFDSKTTELLDVYYNI